MSISGKAIWYIESHLNEELPLEVVASIAGVSRFHLCRAFAASTGCSPAGYVRSRRLSEAAKALARGAPDILTVALDSVYSSHEAFTRAFRQQFGLPPEQVRARADLQQITLQEPFKMQKANTVSLTTPRLGKGEALLLFGLGQHYKGSNAGMPLQWNKFVPYLGHIQGQVGNVAYGVICHCDEASNCDYICGVEVSEFPAHPAEFTRLRIPAQTYAVYEHRDHISSVPNTWKAIWECGLAEAGYQAADGPAYERYDERFDGRTGLGGLEIWVPVTA